MTTTEVRFSQATIGSITRLNGQKLTLDDLVQTFRGQGYVSEPINVVPMPDGKLTSLDNRRLWAAREAGLPTIAAIVHQPDAPFESEKQSRSLIPKAPVIDTEGLFGPPGKTIADEDARPVTVFQAVVLRCFRQRALGLDANYPLGGSSKPPVVTDSRSRQEKPTKTSPETSSYTGSPFSKATEVRRQQGPTGSRKRRAERRGFER